MALNTRRCAASVQGILFSSILAFALLQGVPTRMAFAQSDAAETDQDLLSEPMPETDTADEQASNELTPVAGLAPVAPIEDHVEEPLDNHGSDEPTDTGSSSFIGNSAPEDNAETSGAAVSEGEPSAEDDPAVGDNPAAGGDSTTKGDPASPSQPQTTSGTDGQTDGSGDSNDDEPQNTTDTGDVTLDWVACGTCEWAIDSDGRLIIQPAGGAQEGTLGIWRTISQAPWHERSEEIETVEIRGTIHAQTCLGLFDGCSKLTSIALGGLDFSRADSMNSMFYGCSALENLDLSGWDTSSVTDMGSMFSGCSSLSSLNLEGWDTSQVCDMNYMFSGCSSLKSLDVSGFDTSQVSGDSSSFWSSGMAGMFSGCSSLTELDLSNFDTSHVQNMTSMFNDCSSLTTLDVSGFDTSSVGIVQDEDIDLSFGTDFSSMFSGCTALKSVDISGWDVSHAGNLSCMFYQSGIEEVDISNWDLSNAVTIDAMFYECPRLSKLRLDEIDAPNLKKMTFMCKSCPKLKEVELTHWNAPNLTDADGTFMDCTSMVSVDLTGFCTSSAENSSLSNMFSGCSALARARVSADVKEPVLQSLLVGGETNGHADWWSTKTSTWVHPYTRVGEADLYLRGRGDVDISQASVALKGDGYVYSGSPIKPAVEVSMGKAKFEQNKDYKVTYQNNVKAGTATLTVTGINACKGAIRKTFRIAKASQTIKAQDMTMTYGTTKSLGAKTSGDGKLTYKSSNTSEVKVSSNGTITPVRSGSANITITAAATDNYASAKKTVTITVQRARQTITAPDKTVRVGKTVSIGAKTSGDGQLKYGSKNKTIATVDAKGVITGKKAGTANITIVASTTDRYGWTRKTITVQVKKTPNTMTAKANKAAVTVSYRKLRTKTKVLASNVVVANPKGKVSYANVSANATAKRFSVNRSTGRISIPKGTKKGTYTIKVKTTAAGNTYYLSKSKTIAYRIRVV